ncbi:hypothetical protein BH11BAC2_BH11BAC2_24960 [soil metagenome]
MNPFNGPHQFAVSKIEPKTLELTIPYIRKNKNHLNGIHACALATACEYISGLSLTRHLSIDEYRIILKDIQMTYHYQAKMEATIRYSLPDEEIENLKKVLSTEDATFRWYTVEIYDRNQHHICTGKIHWQIKPWSKTKVKLEG